MASALTFFRPFRPHTIGSILLLGSAPLDLTLRVAARVRTVFPGCTIEAVLREDDRAAAAGEDFAHVTVVRWEDRRDVVRQLRRHRYDAVVVPTSYRGSDYLRALPLLLRTRTILVFNDNLDYFPLHASRLGSLAHHVSGQPSSRALLRWLATRLVVMPAATCVLVASALRLELRAARRRLGA